MRAIVILLAGFVAGCTADHAKPAPEVPRTKVVDTACSWVKTISAAPADTIDTKRQILAHDLAVSKNCPID